MNTRHLVVGLLAHVDAGKTTLSEGLLYCGGTIKKLGRVDHRDAFLDTDALERERGITIFSKQAVLPLEGRTLILLDTPGHVDFSSETERALEVLDYAVLVINGGEGIQSHTETLWRLLESHHIPTFLFLNKMDLPGADPKALLQGLHSRFSEGCLPLGEEYLEELAMCDETLMEEYLDTGTLSAPALAEAIRNRRVFPCQFGSALKLEGVEELLHMLETYTLCPEYPEDFAARVYKISRDSQGTRLTFLKLTGGSLAPKTLLRGVQGGKPWEEKADQIRIYSGAKYTTVSRAQAGMLCAVTGLSHTYVGEGLGGEPDAPPPSLERVLTYQLILPEDCDPQVALPKLRELEEEDPLLNLVWDSRAQAIFLRLMGQVQLEVLQRRILERFGWSVTFGTGQVVYKETIQAPVEGVGHFEPLRHYAEVHLLLEPGPPGSGIWLDTACPEDQLEGHWQRLILTHLAEREHRGVLTGAPLTDVRITLLSGRASVKHTEGGDFREATYRAVRMGLMRAQSVLLEPWYQYRLELPQENLGRAMSDLQSFGGTWELKESDGTNPVLTGAAPVAAVADYAAEVAVYTRGRGRLSLRPGEYRPCQNQQAVVEAAGYDPQADLEHTPDSVFCAHGAGFVVNWARVPEYMHLPWAWREEEEQEPETGGVIRRGGAVYADMRKEDKALEAIFTRTYGPIKERAFLPQAQLQKPDARQVAQQYGPEETFLLVDGYNVIFAWEELNRLAQQDLGAARARLIEILCNYQGFKKCGVILVYDAYKIKGGIERMEQVHNIFVVYTKQAEKADTYIERTTYDLGKHYRIRVVTSDGMEQRIILGHDAQRISSRAFLEEVRQVEAQIAARVRENNTRAWPEEPEGTLGKEPGKETGKEPDRPKEKKGRA